VSTTVRHRELRLHPFHIAHATLLLLQAQALLASICLVFHKISGRNESRHPSTVKLSIRDFSTTFIIRFHENIPREDSACFELRAPEILQTISTCTTQPRG
jgi:hypothetical protein